jgi:hypothetical protein
VGLLGDNQAPDLGYLKERMGGREGVTVALFRDGWSPGCRAGQSSPSHLHIMLSIQGLGVCTEAQQRAT